MNTAVLDIGKTNVKLCVVDLRGTILQRLSRPSQVLHDGPYPHYDLEGIWHWLLESLAEVGRTHAIAAIATTTHGAAAVLLAGDELALPALDYEYVGPESLAADYDALVDPFAKNFSPPLPLGLNLGRQIYWQQHTFPDAFARVSDILTYPQYWSWRLSGRKASEVTSLGAHTDLWFPRERIFSDLVERQGWRKLFPPVLPAWESLGTLRPEVVAATGLDPACRVINGLHDSNASYLRHLRSREAPFAVISTGTWVICMAAGGNLDGLDPTHDTLANVDVDGNPVACARYMGGREFAQIVGRERDFAGVGKEELQAIIDNEIFALPSFAHQGGPFGPRPGRVIPAMPDDPREREALAILYNALVSSLCLELIGARGDLVVEGSLASNLVYPGVMADLHPGRRVYASSDETGTVSGTALLNAQNDAGSGAVAGDTACAMLGLQGLDRYRTAWLAQVNWQTPDSTGAVDAGRAEPER